MCAIFSLTSIIFSCVYILIRSGLRHRSSLPYHCNDYPLSLILSSWFLLPLTLFPSCSLCFSAHIHSFPLLLISLYLLRSLFAPHTHFPALLYFHFLFLAWMPSYYRIYLLLFLFKLYALKIYTVDDLLFNFRDRAGKPQPPGILQETFLTPYLSVCWYKKTGK